MQVPTAVAPERIIKWPEIMEAWVHLEELGASECVSACLVSTWKPRTRHSYTTHLRRFARIGGSCPRDQTQSLAEKVLLSMCASATKRDPCEDAFRPLRQWSPLCPPNWVYHFDPPTALFERLVKNYCLIMMFRSPSRPQQERNQGGNGEAAPAVAAAPSAASSLVPEDASQAEL